MDALAGPPAIPSLAVFRTVARNTNSVSSKGLTLGGGHVRGFWPMRLVLKSAESIWGKISCFPDERD